MFSLVNVRSYFRENENFLQKYQSQVDIKGINFEISEKNTTTILLKIFFNYTKLIALLLGLNSILNIDLDIQNTLSNFFEETFQTLSQVNPIIECLLIGK